MGEWSAMCARQSKVAGGGGHKAHSDADVCCAAAAVRALIQDLQRVGRATTLLSTAADANLGLLDRAWRDHVAQVEAADGEAMAETHAAWVSLQALSGAPARGLSGIVIKLRALLDLLGDTAAFAGDDAPEKRLLITTLEAVDRLASVVADAERRSFADVEALFAAEAVVMPARPPERVIAAGARAAQVPLDVARSVYDAMLAAVRSGGAS